jgi:hypothetical protein
VPVENPLEIARQKRTGKREEKAASTVVNALLEDAK